MVRQQRGSSVPLVIFSLLILIIFVLFLVLYGGDVIWRGASTPVGGLVGVSVQLSSQESEFVATEHAWEEVKHDWQATEHAWSAPPTTTPTPTWVPSSVPTRDPGGWCSTPTPGVFCRRTIPPAPTPTPLLDCVDSRVKPGDWCQWGTLVPDDGATSGGNEVG